jgi:hypothetical protein
MDDGAVAKKQIDTPLGNVLNRMSLDQVTQKYRKSAGRVLSSEQGRSICRASPCAGNYNCSTARGLPNPRLMVKSTGKWHPFTTFVSVTKIENTFHM